MATDTMSVLQALDKEYGIANVPDNLYHVTLSETSKPYEGKEGRTPSFRFGWKVRSGEYTGREIADFLGWFPSNSAKMADKDAVRAARGTTVQMLKALSFVLDDNRQARLDELVIGLRDSATPTEANAYLSQIATLARGVHMVIRAKTRPAKNKDGTIDETKDGFQNVQYLEKGQPIQAIDPDVVAAVRV